MKHVITPNGNLEITCEDSEKEELQDILDSTYHRDHGFLAEMLEYAGWSTNGKLHPVMPEWIGALTDAPIVSDDVVFNDDGSHDVPGKVWWFPSYELESFAETLIKTGRVLFRAAPENSK